jgi:hypothetical protein
MNNGPHRKLQPLEEGLVGQIELKNCVMEEMAYEISKTFS